MTEPSKYAEDSLTFDKLKKFTSLDSIDTFKIGDYFWNTSVYYNEGEKKFNHFTSIALVPGKSDYLKLENKAFLEFAEKLNDKKLTYSNEEGILSQFNKDRDKIYHFVFTPSRIPGQAYYLGSVHELSRGPPFSRIQIYPKPK